MACPTELATRALGWHAPCSPDAGATVSINAKGEAPITLAQMQALATAFQTDAIEIVHIDETAPYSDVTGGDPSSLTIVIRGVRAELEWQASYWINGRSVQRNMQMRNGVIEEAPGR